MVGPAARLKSHDLQEIVAVLHSAADLAAAELLNS
ncbi:transcriptional regulator [Bordetella pertussis]|nr:transcriptional regulator [Bordetella pertussis]CPN81708.1 transcriptional regulator [Bordetella pertussis]